MDCGQGFGFLFKRDGAITAGMISPQPPPRRPVGRPSRLSREQVIRAALELLNEGGLEAFSVAKLGKRLNASAMSLYTYFPSRDALLDAIADDVFKSFEAPCPDQDWRVYVREWLDRVAAHFRQHRVALTVIAWEEHLSVGWLRAWLPLVRVLATTQPDEERLAAALSWFSHSAIGLINARIRGPQNIVALGEVAGQRFAEADQKLLYAHIEGAKHLDPDWVFRFGFDNLVSGLEQILLDVPPAQRKSAAGATGS